MFLEAVRLTPQLIKLLFKWLRLKGKCKYFDDIDPQTKVCPERAHSQLVCRQKPVKRHLVEILSREKLLCAPVQVWFHFYFKTTYNTNQQSWFCNVCSLKISLSTVAMYRAATISYRAVTLLTHTDETVLCTDTGKLLRPLLDLL